MGDSSSATVPAEETRPDPDDPAAGGSNAFACSAQALLQLSPFPGLVLVVGRPVVCVGQAPVQGLARYTPTHVAAWPLRRLRAAGRGQWARVLEGLVSEALAAFPPPQERVLYWVVERTLKGKRSKQTPLAQKGRLNDYAPFTCGLHVVLLIAQGEVYRMPVAFRLVKPPGSKE